MWTKEQEQAIYKTGTNIIVSAGAGSGKTAVLTERVITKLKSGININELLILTFTNAASAEMKERIREKIVNAKGLDRQLDLLTNAYICTFDSFSLSLVKKYHYVLNIDSTVSIMDDNVNYLQASSILDEIMDELYQKKDANFAKLITEYCIKDDKQVKQGILDLYKKIDLLVDKDTYLQNYDALDNALIYYKDFENLALKMIKNIYKLTCSSYDIDLSDYQNYLSKFIEGTYDINKFKEKYDLPRLKKNTDEETKQFKDLLNKEIEKVQDFIGEESKDTKIKRYLSTKDNVYTIIQIILDLDKRLNNFKKLTNTYTFMDIAKMAIRLVKENEDIRLELLNTFKEIMIDEYQDTSDIQEYFVSMIANNNVYAVGDIKQSIYRFRNANPYLFEQKYDNYKMNNGGYKIDLTNNFRSRSDVVCDINNIFKKCMTKEMGKAAYSVDHIMKAGNHDYDNVNCTSHTAYVLKYQNEKTGLTDVEIEAYLIAKDIKDKVNNHYQVMDKITKESRDVRYSDFAILIDRSNTFDLYKQIFNFNQIPLNVFKDEKINDNYDIKIIYNILKLLVAPNFSEFSINEKYEFISILRSYLFETPDDEIYEMYCNNSYYSHQLYDSLSKLRSMITSLSISEIIKIIDQTFGLVSKASKITNTKQVLVHLEYLASLGNSLSLVGYTIDDYVKHLDEVFENKLDIRYKNNLTSFDDAVKIMTIHTSKGLEFGICYFPSLNNSFNMEDIKKDFVFDNKYGIIIPSVDNGKHDTFLKRIVNSIEKDETISEEVRVFYVALTRAKEQIVFVSKEEDIRPTLKPSNFKYLVYGYLNNLKSYYMSEEDLNNFKQINESISHLSIEKLKEGHINLLPNTIENSVIKEKIEKGSFSKKINDLITLEVTNVLSIGTSLHEALERLDFKNPDFSVVNIDEKYYHYLRNFLDSELMKNIQNATIYKEYNFYDQNNDSHGSIDLMLEYSDHIDIIDYKLKHIDDEGYVSQLNGYRDYIRSKTNKPINIYLYSIFDKKYNKL
ncbi:MAG: UvrD-helicase domain-containing protein [Bacilli bacterium]|nr:UvrD-helicase domain-containing protein [Bacilli bacterium]